MKADDKLIEQSRAFALRTVRMHAYLRREKKEFYLSKYVLRAGTAKGARLSCAVREMEAREFRNTVKAALKEADETSYWIDLLLESGCITEKAYESIREDCRDLARALESSLGSAEEEGSVQEPEKPAEPNDFPEDPGDSNEPVELPDFTNLSY